jgi:DNA mismatch endonuclease, patch repair protein
MTDIFSKEKRSSIMQKIGSKDSTQELFIRKLLHSMGYRFRLHRKDLPGCPDIVFPKYKKVLFIHGCFWHGHKGCKRAVLPSENRNFWEEKIGGNINRDKSNYIKLRKKGWNYLIIWQCRIKRGNEKLLMQNIKKYLTEETGVVVN